MGWRFYRIWSTDWFYRRGEAIQMLKAALEVAKPQPRRRVRRKRLPCQNLFRLRGVKFRRRATRRSDRDSDLPTTEFAVVQGVGPHLTPIARMARVTKAIVEAEGPIHQDGSCAPRDLAVRKVAHWIANQRGVVEFAAVAQEIVSAR